MGTPEDTNRFMAIVNADMEKRAQACADKLFAGRIQLLPVAETIGVEEDEV